ncbi:hypothetical protein T07_8902 [Trichinella nelsoni]|uniref:Uncharacterized protein n=1 Tax=Trichinella nelsoni TaxID=6336 RepID=A0A0V0RA18_9BILA|nr:hypothetical protein T07_8902 [Trichinella nelsoni]
MINFESVYTNLSTYVSISSVNPKACLQGSAMYY